MGCFNSSHTAAALPTVLPGHGAFGYLADPRHDVLAARPRTVLHAIAEVTSRAGGQA